MKQTKKEEEEQKRLELAILATLSDRFDEVEHLYQEKEKLVNKISRRVKWKKAKIRAKVHFDLIGYMSSSLDLPPERLKGYIERDGFIATIEGKEYDMWRDPKAGFMVSPIWRCGKLTSEALGLNPTFCMLGETKPEATKKLVSLILDQQIEKTDGKERHEYIGSPMTKEQFHSQEIKWKKSRDFANTGEWTTIIRSRVGGRIGEYDEYSIYRDPEKGFWYPSYSTAWKIGISTDKALSVLNKKDATAKLLQLIWEIREGE